MRRIFKILFAIVMMIFFTFGCTRYETKIQPLKMPSAYPNAVRVGDALIGAEAYNDSKLATEAFGFDIRGADILPVRVVFDNQGQHALEIVSSQTFIIDEANNAWPVLDQNLAYERLSKKTELGEVMPQGAKYGALGGLAGGIIGAAIGIVSGSNVGDAAMKGAAAGAAAGATLGGVKGLTDGEVQERIRDDLSKRSLDYRPIKPMEIAYGFIFFPGEAKNARELRIRIKDHATGQVYPLIMPLTP
ncbi:MAG: hypothetical protein JW902_10480 [Syntrophaceae bacterium]|nr:hypothetical protein [Syntrophaceae bacterium]